MQTELVSVRRNCKEDDGGGGEILTPSRPIVFQAGVRFYKKTTWERLEGGHHGTDGPGAQTVERRVFTVTLTSGTPPPDVRINDTLTRPNGALYRVLNVRLYDWTLQIDAERIQQGGEKLT